MTKSQSSASYHGLSKGILKADWRGFVWYHKFKLLLWIKGIHFLSKQIWCHFICRSKWSAYHNMQPLWLKLLLVNAQDFFFPRMPFVLNQVCSSSFFFLMDLYPTYVAGEEKKLRAAKPAISAWQMIFLNLDLINPIKYYISTIGWKSFFSV